MKYCIAGKNNISVEILEYLFYEKKIPKKNLFVCCNKSDNGVNLWQRSLRFAAKTMGIKEVSLTDIYEIEDLVFLSLEFDKIINPELFKSKKLYNIHFSFLPKYKGMYTSVLPILNNESYTGVTFHFIDKGIDTGPIIAQKKIEINFNDTARDIYLKNIFWGTQLVKECIDTYLNAEFQCLSFPQTIQNSSYYSAKSIDFNNICINLNQTALSIHNQIRAYNFREYQLPCVEGYKIRFAEITRNRSTEKSGTILWQSDNCMMISTIDFDVVLYFDFFDRVMEACMTNDIKKLSNIAGLKNYVNEKNSHGWTPLIVATYNGLFDISMFLISQGADIYSKNNNGTNLLMYAKDAFLKTGDDRLLKFYYSKGISFDQKDYKGLSLIDYCDTHDIEILKEICG